MKRINKKREEEREERIAARNEIAKVKSEKKRRVQVWKFDYMAKKHQKKVAECLGLESTNTGKKLKVMVYRNTR